MPVGNYYFFVWKAFIGFGVIICGNNLLRTEIPLKVIYARVALIAR